MKAKSAILQFHFWARLADQRMQHLTQVQYKLEQIVYVDVDYVCRSVYKPKNQWLLKSTLHGSFTDLDI